MSWFREKFKKNSSVEVYADLDKLIEEPLKIMVLGKVRTIKPMTVKEFYKLTNALARFHATKTSDGETMEEVIGSYYEVISSVSDDFTLEDIKQMSQAQVGALYSIIVDHAHGRSDSLTQDDVKKKTLKMFGAEASPT